MSPPTWMAWARLSSMGRISCCCPEAANVRWIASPFAVARTLMSLLIRSSAVVSKAVHCSGISSSSHLRKPDARIAAPWRKGCNSCGSWQRRSNRWVGAHFRWISADQSRIVCKEANRVINTPGLRSLGCCRLWCRSCLLGCVLMHFKAGNGKLNTHENSAESTP